jgi:hypothetical protein
LGTAGEAHSSQKGNGKFISQLKWPPRLLPQVNNPQACGRQKLNFAILYLGATLANPDWYVQHSGIGAVAFLVICL